MISTLKIGNNNVSATRKNSGSLLFELQLFGTSFFENLVAVVLTRSQSLLLLVRQVRDLLTLLATTIFHLFGTVLALNKEQVTSLIGTVHMGITWFSTLMTIGDHVFTDALPSAVIEHKVLAEEFVL